jgi:Peptidase family M28
MRTRSALAVLLVLLSVVPAVLFAQAPSHVTAPAFTADELMAHVTTLAAPEMAGRATGTPGNARARSFVMEQFRAAGLEPLGKTFEMPFTFERKQPANGKTEAVKMQGINLGGICRGRGAKDAGKDNGALVITAHYDHLGVRDSTIYHGADDNASGVTMLLALARQCRSTPFLHDAIFIAFDAEEMGLQGARAFLATVPVPTNRTIALNINFDMVARGDKNELYIAGTHHTPALKPILEPVVSRSKIKVLFGHDSGGGQNDWTTQSDHAAFHEAGVPFIYFGVEDHPDYHKPSDTADKINPAFFYQSALTIADAVRTIDRALPLPAQ